MHTPIPHWQPGANTQRLLARARLYRQIREYFSELNVLEVDVPCLAQSGGTDPNIELIPCANELWLQSSPEFFLKRLLAAGSGDIYSLGKAYRLGERGRHHNPEFTLLEWYRCGLDAYQLANEVTQLLQMFAPSTAVSTFDYGELFALHLAINPQTASTETLAALAKPFIQDQWLNVERDVWLDLLFTHAIQPMLPEHICVIHHYPASQAALARLTKNSEKQWVACRFEIYWQHIELANGYHELTDHNEQQQRFALEQAARAAHGQNTPPIDAHFLAALEAGMPDCSGVALGVDRLLMILEGANSLDEVMSFSAQRV